MILIFRRLRCLALVAALLPLVPAAARAQGPEDVARRIATTASIAADEYATGVRGGTVVLAEEYEEARLFLEEARRAAGDLPAAARPAAIAALDSLLADVRRLADPATVTGGVDRLRAQLASALGITLDVMPERPPSLALGAERYQALCAQCHGAAGAGDGELAAGLSPPPSDLTDPVLAATSPLEFFRKINVGVAATAMPAFEDQLTAHERWSLALYASGLRHDPADRDAGAAWAEAACGGCRVVMSGIDVTAAVSDDSLLGLAAGEFGAVPPEPGAVVAWARTAAAAEHLGGDDVLAARRAARLALARARDALELLQAGDPETASREALQGYLAYEAIERRVAARDAGASREVESAFAGLRAAAAADDAPAAVDAYGRVQAALDGAVAALERPSGTGVLFGQSVLIMVREGLEAILIIGAMIAFLVRAGAHDRLREIGWGVAGAIGASFLTAGVFAFIFQVSAAHQEALEGVTMLLAAAVLFWVASWLVSKIEAEKWKAFVGGQMQKALASQGKLALIGLAFLVVYREGFETVLFYAALYASADSTAGAAGVTAGMVAGAVVLAVVYFVIRRYGVRLPLRPIFAVTGMLLLVLAFSFAGQGVAELQEAGLMPLTPLAWLPRLPALGVFPTVQTVTAQVLLAAAFLAAVSWFYWRAPNPAVSR